MVPVILSGPAVLAGGAIAWMDTRSGWDDTGIAAPALLAVNGLVALMGLRWWIAAGLVVWPLVFAELGSSGVVLN
jgi:hypothetical protein